MENIKKILNDSIVIDSHFDLLYEVVKKRQRGSRKVIVSDYLSEFIEGGVNVVVSSLFIDDEFLPEMALRKALNQVSALYDEISESPDKIMLCRNYKDILEAKKTCKVGIMLSFEGVEPIYNDITLLRIFYELGVRIIGLTWSRRNYAGDGCGFGNGDEGTKGGITDFGMKLIKEAEKLGMIIDVSHLNDEGFWDVIKIAKKPIIASHSNSRALAGIMRNLTDDQIRAIASKGGVIGINSASILVAADDEVANMEYLANHVDYIVQLVGVEHVGFGFDFCDHLIEFYSFNQLDGLSRKPFDVIKGYKEINKFVAELIRRGYKQKELELILGGNFLRVYKKVLT
ncbi:dipeptidase [Carboxydocella sp. ULO1]|uniref:dipeptidase n=1 Tax=Carboxydocella sp. ULO1 TaxID=1926599 RepID=UPI0009ADED9B|nr:dipeptidase [Carboxydocella sp. ULO1]GAW28860.1 membrane dipeptidase [Carboxydocella sp. ULO1]